MEIKTVRLIIDSIAKYLVLFAFTGYIGFFVYKGVTNGQEINMPDWIVMLFTIVFQFFFRRGMKEVQNDTGGKNPKQSTG